MERAAAAFEREGFEVIPAATDHQAPLDSDPAILPTLQQVIAATLDFAKGYP